MYPLLSLCHFLELSLLCVGVREPCGLIDGGAVLVDRDRVSCLWKTTHLTTHLYMIIMIIIKINIIIVNDINVIMIV